MDSYQFIGTYAVDSGVLTNWMGPHSGVGFYAPDNLGYNMPVSAIDLGDSIAAVPYNVLNVGSPFGSDKLDLTSAFVNMAASDTSLYSTTNAPVFNWNGNPNSQASAPTTSASSTPRMESGPFFGRRYRHHW